MKLLAVAACLVGGALGLEAATYSNITTNMGTYLLRGQADTWTGCMMTLTNGMIVESNAVVGMVSCTNTCVLPLNALYRQSNYAGRNWPGAVWARDSLIRVCYENFIGYKANGSMHLTNCTYIAERDPANGNIALQVGSIAGSHTGVLELVNSRLFYNSTSSPYSYLWLGTQCNGRLTAINSSIGSSTYKFGKISSWGGTGTRTTDQVVGWFNASTATVHQFYVGGDPLNGPFNGKFTFTNGSLLSMPGGWTPAWVGLIVGHSGGTAYTSTVTFASSSRLETVHPTLVGYQSAKRGQGRLTFTDHSTGVMRNDVTLGVETGSSGWLDVLSGSRIDVTNALGTAKLKVGIQGFGRLGIDGGTCKVDNLFVTNGVNSVLAFPAGRLSVKTGLIANNTALTIGNGIGAATFEQWGGGTTVVQGAMRFKANSQWSVAVDASADKVLDVAGELSFDPGVTLALTTTGDYAALDGRVLALANTASSRPNVLAD